MGGDGSLGCFLDSLRSEPHIASQVANLVFVPLPYGTGNDLSRSLGWGPREGKWAASLVTLARAIVKAPRDVLSVWDVKIEAKGAIEGYSQDGNVVLSKEDQQESGL